MQMFADLEGFLLKLLYFEWSPPWHLYILLYKCHGEVNTFPCAHKRLPQVIFSAQNWKSRRSWKPPHLRDLAQSHISNTAESDKHAISSGILSGILFGILSGILFGILSGILFLRSSGAHWSRELAVWGPAVHTGVGSWPFEVQRCTLRSIACQDDWRWRLAMRLAMNIGDEHWRGGRKEGKKENNCDKI